MTWQDVSVSDHSWNKTPFGECYTCFGYGKPKRGWYIFWIIFKIGLCSAISFKRSRRELSIDVDERSSIFGNKGAMRLLVIFQDRPMLSHIIQKDSARAFHWCGWTVNVALSCKIKDQRVFWLVFKIGLCSAISFKRFRRKLSVDVAEHSSIFKNMGAIRILVIFQDRPLFSQIIEKVSARAFHW